MENQMRKIAIFMLAGVAMLFMSKTAQAGPANAQDAFSIGINQIHDKDAEIIVNSSGQQVTTSAVGDFLVAIAQFNNIGIVSKDPNHFFDGTTFNELTAISLIKIGTLTDTGTTFSNGTEKWSYSMVAPTATEWSNILGLTVPTGTMASIYNNVNNNFTFTSGSIATDLASAVAAGHLMWNFGFTGAANGDGDILPNGTNEGWIASAPIDQAGILAVTLAGDATEMAFKAQMNVINYGPDGLLLLNTFADYKLPVNLVSGNPSQIQYTGTLAASSTDFPIGSLSNAFVNVAPEPATVVLFTMGLGVVGARYMRKRKARLA
jgi:hypothetical protein